MNSSPANREACPVCGGNGFVAVVAERRHRVTKTLVRSGPQPRPAPSTTHALQQSWPRQAASNALEGLAYVLLEAFRGDTEWVAKIFEGFAHVDSQALSRDLWNATAAIVRAGAIP